VCNARCERATFGHALGTATLLLKKSDALVKLGVLDTYSNSTSKRRK
jgi:hypothetical protein